MALTITLSNATPHRLRYRLDADTDGFDGCISLATLLADCVAGPLQRVLAEKAALALPADGAAAVERLFGDGQINSRFCDGMSSTAKLVSATYWGIMVSVSTDIDLYPSVAGSGAAGGRAYWELQFVHSVDY